MKRVGLYKTQHNVVYWADYLQCLKSEFIRGGIGKGSLSHGTSLSVSFEFKSVVVFLRMKQRLAIEFVTTIVYLLNVESVAQSAVVGKERQNTPIS